MLRTDLPDNGEVCENKIDRQKERVPLDKVAVILSKGFVNLIMMTRRILSVICTIAKKLTNAARDLPRSRLCSREASLSER